MLINFVDTTNDANHYTKPPPGSLHKQDNLYKPSKLSQPDLVFGLCLMFANRSVLAGYKSLRYSGYDFLAMVNTQTHRQLL